MIEIDIPGFKKMKLHHLVLDFNGTLAIDGIFVQGVKERLKKLDQHLEIHILTADTFGNVQKQLDGISCNLRILTNRKQDIQKMDYVNTLGSHRCVCIGNGKNDHKMLRLAELGISVILEEGACTETINAADIVSKDINSALDLLSEPLRLTATLRS